MVYLASSGFWGNLGMLSVSLFALGLYSVYARFLTPEQYGVYQYLLSLGVLLNALTLTGMNAAVTRSVALGFDGVLVRSVRLQLRYALLPLIVSIGGAGYYFLNGNNVLAGGILLLGIFAPVTAAFNTYGAYLVGKKDFRRAFLYGFAMNVPYYASMAAAAYFFQEALPVLIANVLVGALGMYLAYRAVLRAYVLNTEDDPSAYPYGKHLSTMNAPGVWLSQADAIMIFHFLGAGGLAVYSFATALPDQLTKFLKFIPGAALPKFSVHADMLKHSIGRYVVQLLFITGLLVALYFAAAALIYSVLFPQYAEAVSLSRLYALSLPATVAAGLVTTALTAQGRTKTLYLVTTGSPVIQTFLQLGGLLLAGLVGLVIARVLSSLVQLSIALTLFYKRS